MKAEVVKIDEKTFKVMLGQHEIGASKTDFDARFHVNAINDVLESRYQNGYNDGHASGLADGYAIAAGS